MLQHLINATAIWLLSLAVFDMFLRRETYHGYNRAYLLLTFFAGLLLPLWQWDNNSFIQATGMATPVSNTDIIRQNIVNAAPAETSAGWEQWLMLAYIAGAFISLLFVLRDAFIISSFYRKGIRSRDGVWTIVETNKEHSPFSAFRFIFISNKQNYTAEQLHTILVHEEQHGHSLHFIDLLIMQLAKVVFWFHPLVYFYHSRLMMVHEYQADAVAGQKPADYGHFLIEQAMLKNAPALSHSFNRLPIKKRIIMLTRKTSASAKGKQLVLAPLFLACLLFFTQKAFSDEKKKQGNKLHYKGNVFELWAPGPDTVMVEDPSNGEMVMKIVAIDSFPVKMNEQHIYTENELTAEEKANADKTKKEVEAYIFKNIKNDLEKLDDGTYSIFTFQTTIDKKGKIVYNYTSQLYMHGNTTKRKDYSVLAQRINEVASQKGEDFTPVKREGKPIIFRWHNLFSESDDFTIKDHQIVNK